MEKLIGRPKHRGIQKDPLLGGGEGECNVEEVDCDNWMLRKLIKCPGLRKKFGVVVASSKRDYDIEDATASRGDY